MAVPFILLGGAALAGMRTGVLSPSHCRPVTPPGGVDGWVSRNVFRENFLTLQVAKAVALWQERRAKRRLGNMWRRR